MPNTAAYTINTDQLPASIDDAIAIALGALNR